MDWIELTVYTTEEGLPAVSARFDMLGITEVVVEQGKRSIQAYLDENAKYWDYADADELIAGDIPAVKAYIQAEDQELLDAVHASFEELKGMDVGLDLGSLDIEEKAVKNEDWESSWKVNYKPIEIGERLLICPSWEDAESTGRIVIDMDPGMAFGTGSHHTTRMCLEYLEEYAPSCNELIDLGCGSGILSIAALLLGAKHATGVDIDPIAETVATANAELNCISCDSFTVVCGDILEDGAMLDRLTRKQYDVVCANIAANVIIAFAPVFMKLMAKDGVTIASGIINERLDEVTAAIEAAGLRVAGAKRGDDWNALLIIRA